MKKTAALVIVATLLAGQAFASSDVFKIHCTMDTQVTRDRSYNEMLAAFKDERHKDNFLLGAFLPVFAMNSFNAGIETIDLEYSKLDKKGLLTHTGLVRGPFHEGAGNEVNDTLSNVLEKNTSSARVLQLLDKGQARSSDLALLKEEISSLPQKMGWETSHPIEKDELGSDSACFPQTLVGKSCMARNLGVGEMSKSSLVVISYLGRLVLGKDLAHSKLDLAPIKCKIVEGDLMLSEKQVTQENDRAKQLKAAWLEKQKKNMEIIEKNPDLPVDASNPPY